MSFHKVCSLSDLEPGAPVSVEVGENEVAIVRTEDDQVFAIRDECSHAEIPLSEGEVEGCTLECWLHGSRFDLRTGEPTGLPATEPVPVYAVRVNGEDVEVSDEEAAISEGVTLS